MADTAPVAAPPAAKATPEAPAAEAPKAEVKPPEARKFKFEMPEVGEVEIPEEDARGVLSQFARMTSQELVARKKLAELEPMLEDDEKLEELLRKRGKDPAKLAEAWLSKYLKSQIDETTLTPEQKEIRDLKAAMAKRDADAKAEIDKKAAEQHEADKKIWFEKFKATAVEALKQTAIPAELHEHPEILKRIGALMKRNEELEYDVSPLVLAKQLEAALVKEHDYVFSKFTPETLYKRLGRKGVEALIKLYAAEMSPKPAEAPKPAPARRVSANEDPAELKARARELQYQRVRDEQQMLRGTASGRTNRYYGKG